MIVIDGSAGAIDRGRPPMRWSIAAVLSSVFAATFVVGCPAEPPPLPPKPLPVVVEPPTILPPPREDGHLPPLAIPGGYAIDLDVDPNQPRFKGSIRIAIEIPQKTSFLVLHGHGLEVTAARAESFAEQRELPPVPAKASWRVAQGGKAPEELVLAFEKPLPQAHASLVIDYNAPFDDELSGLYRLKDGESWYAFTQFEPTDARRAFPCFDEPAFKVPFDVSVTVPRKMIAVANAPETSREDLGVDKTRFRFARTAPLPTYLVALAVGELEIKDATRYSRPPIRIVTTKGKAQGPTTQLALEATGALVDALGEWFGIPYPYEKLDIVAVPDFRSGAMENPGLITFREERLLLDPARASVQARRGQALVIAHELAHQWFGDLVTASWWNDLWLNEGMATWMEWRIVDKWKPSFNARADGIVAAHEVMDLDGLASARAVRQPVISTSDADEAFDGITYEKGAAILATIERWIGEEPFQRAVREYLKDNAFKSVQADRLLGALDKAAGKDVSAMALQYLDKPGVPDVFVHLECEPGSRWHMEISSGQWRPLGSKLPEESSHQWTIPVCVRRDGEKTEKNEKAAASKNDALMCTDLVAGAPSLIAGRGCPAFAHPNWGSAYYRFSMSEKEFTKLAEGRAQLDTPARVSVLSNAWAAVRSGQLEPKALLKILPAFDDDNTRQVSEQVVVILNGMSEALVDPELRPAFQKFALARLTKRKKALGWTTTKNEDDALARRSVLLAMADVVEDETTMKEAEDVATKWLADPTSIDSDIGAVAIDIASRKAPETRIDALLNVAKTSKSREDRISAIKALMGFGNQARLEKALDVTLTEDIRANEMRYVWSAAFGRRAAQPIVEAWIRAHWDALQKKLPGALSRQLVRAAGVGCSKADADERAAFYGPRFATIDGMNRGYTESLEAISLCTALKEKGSTNLRKAMLPPDPKAKKK